jgi:hypothetical protein
VSGATDAADMPSIQRELGAVRDRHRCGPTLDSTIETGRPAIETGRAIMTGASRAPMTGPSSTSLPTLARGAA